jgi:hypothetical protein
MWQIEVRAPPSLGAQPRERCRRAGGWRPGVSVHAAAARVQDDSVWLQLRELLGHTAGDPGHWNYSPEWWGTQGGGWGRDAGQVVFSRESPLNGRVEVTAHAASLNGFDSAGTDPAGAALRDEWRVLRFNGVTRQSVARVRVVDAAGAATRRQVGSDEQQQQQQQRWWLEDGQDVAAVPECLAQEYLKSMASLAAAVLGLQRLLPSLPGNSLRAGRLRVLCIGLGGGSLPLFLAHHFPFADVDGVEIDPVVVEAATSAMGLPAAMPNMALHVADGLAFVAGAAGGQRPPYDLVCMDAFTGDDTVPSVLCGADFAALLARALHPAHGTLLVNFHGIEVRALAATFGAALLPPGGAGGCAFSLSTQKQQNVTMACARGLQLPADAAGAKERLRLAAAYVADGAGYAFPAGARASRNYAPLHREP